MSEAISPSSNVVRFYSKDAAKDPDVVLERAAGCYESVLILGLDRQGGLDARASTNLDVSRILYLIEKFKLNLLSGVYRGEE